MNPPPDLMGEMSPGEIKKLQAEIKQARSMIAVAEAQLADARLRLASKEEKYRMVTGKALK